MIKSALPLILSGISFWGKAQDMLSQLDSVKGSKDHTIATFKGTRLINFHTIETLTKGTLEVRIAHRFGAFSSGPNNFYGLDGPATLQLHFDYALTDRLMVGIGRSSDQKIVDGFIKYRVLRQTTDGSMPISFTLLGTANITSIPNSVVQDEYKYFSSRLSYLASFMVARKFNSRMSLQISPTILHFNIVENLNDKNDILSVNGGFRYKLTKRTAVTLEYSKHITPYTANSAQYHDVFGIGFDIDTGGHIFQVFFTNGASINETRTIAYTTSSINKGLALGFNISRVFSVHKKAL